MQPMMGTFVEIGVTSTSQATHDVISTAFQKMKAVDRLLSFHQKDSQLSQLNRDGINGVYVDSITLDVLKKSRHMMQQSHGAFNYTAGGALVDYGILPDHGGPKSLAIGTDDDIEINDNLVILKRPLRLNFDGIAKGYAVDLAVQYLLDMGISSGWVNAGGDLRTFGNIDIPVHRRELDGQLTFLGRYKNTSVATSSVGIDYQARFPGTIIDRSLAIKRGIWTISAPKAWLADALTKVAAVSPSAQARSIISSLGGKLVYGLSL